MWREKFEKSLRESVIRAFSALQLRRKLYRWTSDDYDLKEALFWPRLIDIWIRYSKVLNEVRKEIKKANGIISILDVGCGGEGIAEFLWYSRDLRRRDVVLLDISKERMKNVELGLPVVGNGCALPFKNNSFDIVVSVDSVEHVPRKNRTNYLNELKRVSKNKVLLHFPADSPAEGFEGRKSDILFQKKHKKIFGKLVSSQTAHINCGHPTLKEIRRIFPGGVVQGDQNAKTWLDYMIFSRYPIVGFFAGFLYRIKWKRKNNRPPFYGCLFKWSKKEE